MSLSTSTVKSPSPTNAPPIKVRRMDLAFDDELPPFWFDDNPHLTAVLTGLAVAFPPGERFFISSVRHFLPKIEDPELRSQIQGFIGQEANHTKEHLAFNRFLDARGIPAKEMEDFVSKMVATMQKKSSPEACLARTAALEHFTAILASALLAHPEVMETLSPEVRTLWAWHAIEEIEHRSVAFDVYKTAVNDEKLRIRMMLMVTAVFLTLNAWRTSIALRAQGKFWDLRSAAKAWNVLAGRPGIFRKVIPQYLAYYRKDFHPSQHDVDAIVARAKEVYLGDRA